MFVSLCNRCIVFVSMSIFAAIILGLVQGLTEFIPVSSSGHMILAAKLFNIPSNFTFDVALNIGTLLALLLYYRVVLLDIWRRLVRNRDWQLVLKLAVATLPAIVVGFALQSFIEDELQSAWIVVIMLLLVGGLMVLSGRHNKGKTIDRLPLSGALRIGLAQVVALIPGTSRSGVTVLAGEREGLTAVEAAKFSFLLAIPTISGALLKVVAGSEGRAFVADNLTAVVMGNIVSFVAGYMAVTFLIDLLGKKGLRPFGWYRIGLGALLICLLFAKII